MHGAKRDTVYQESCVAFLIYFLMASPALSYLVINPVFLELSSKVTVQEVIMENQSSETKAFEVSLKKWEQDEGQDIYSDTSEIVVLPLATKIPPSSKQKFRLVLKSPPQGTKQVAYRLFIVERPYKTTSDNTNSIVTFLLNMTVPVFVTGTQFKAIERASWSADFAKQNNSIVLSLANQGSKFIKIRDITVKEIPAFRSGDWQYVLPGTTLSFTIPFAKKTTPESLAISYAAVDPVEEKKQSVTIPLSFAKLSRKASDQDAPITKVAAAKP
ncbi:MAG TPA: fimbria/pilus periplasmic chaperone [Myxococcota bacterium]|nr:fimbria/pilus periplasmic chaperone [Myxococcota bacterium]